MTYYQHTKVSFNPVTEGKQAAAFAQSCPDWWMTTYTTAIIFEREDVYHMRLKEDSEK